VGHNNNRDRIIEILDRIGTEAAINKIRDALHIYQSSWSNNCWIQGLGIVGEPAMVKHLMYLLHFSDEYTYKSSKDPYINLLEVSSLCCEAIFELVDNDPEETKLIPPLLGNLNQEKLHYFLDCFCRFTVAIDRSHLSVLLKYLEDDRLELRAYALTNLPVISDDSILPILISALSDDELIIRQAAVKGIVRLNSSATQPILLKLAANSELVTTLIEELKRLSWLENRPIVLAIDLLTRSREFSNPIVVATIMKMMELLH
jgi:HEAT repeat protein